MAGQHALGKGSVLETIGYLTAVCCFGTNLRRERATVDLVFRALVAGGAPVEVKLNQVVFSTAQVRACDLQWAEKRPAEVLL